MSFISLSRRSTITLEQQQQQLEATRDLNPPPRIVMPPGEHNKLDTAAAKDVLFLAPDWQRIGQCLYWLRHTAGLHCRRVTSG